MSFPLTTFITLTISGAISPGPNNIMCMTLGQNLGFKKSIKYIYGIIVGYVVLLFLLSLLYNILQIYLPILQNIMKILGAIYLCYLAWLIYHSTAKNTNNNIIISEDKLFSTAFYFQFVNPKSILYGTTVLSTFIFPYIEIVQERLVAIFFMVFATFISLIIWAGCGSILNTFLNTYKKEFNIFMAILLIYCAIQISDIIPIIQTLLS